jgi:hypothetical protein
MTNDSLVNKKNTWRLRLCWMIILVAVQGLYLPINRLTQKGVILKTPLDDHIPLLPIWAVPYLLSLVWWGICFIWALRKMNFALYRAFVISLLVSLATSYIIYLVYPTYVERPPLKEDGWAMQLMQLIYSSDRPYNAFPSTHTFTTLLISLFWWQWYPRSWWIWSGIVAIVLLSTLFTRQHNLPDLIGGIVLAVLGYRFGLWWVTIKSKET